jgi:hypothetical protein
MRFAQLNNLSAFAAHFRFALLFICLFCAGGPLLSNSIDVYYNDLAGDQLGLGKHFTVKDDRFGGSGKHVLRQKLCRF